MLIAFHKPMNTLSQFTDEGKWPGLSRFGLPSGVYAAGRLDRDSEGLLLLTDDGPLQAKITGSGTAKTYLVQVEGTVSDAALTALRAGVSLKDGMTRPAIADRIAAPDVPARDPPVRFRKSVPDAWIQMTIREGRNRQVRRMCAHVGLPCLRLIRLSIGPHRLDGLAPGTFRTATA